MTPPDDLPSAHNHTGRVCDRHCPAWDHEAARRDLAPPDDLPSPKGLACDSLLKRAKEDL